MKDSPYFLGILCRQTANLAAVLCAAMVGVTAQASAQDLASLTSSTEFLDVELPGTVRPYIGTTTGTTLPGFAYRPSDLPGTRFSSIARVLQIGRRNSFRGSDVDGGDNGLSLVQAGDDNSATALLYRSYSSSIFQAQVGNSNSSSVGIIASRDVAVSHIQAGSGIRGKIGIIAKPGTRLLVISAPKR